MLAALTQDRSGPVVLVGEAGIGRTTLLRYVRTLIDPGRYAVLALDTDRPGPLGLVGAGEPPAPADTTALVEHGVTALVRRAGSRRPVVLLDDAHRADYPTMLALRELHRRHGAVLLLTQPAEPDPGARPDMVDCLRYEPGFRTVRIPPLTAEEVGAMLLAAGEPAGAARSGALHAATGGNPTLLAELRALAAAADRGPDGSWPPADPAARTRDPRLGRRLIAAVEDAWCELRLDRIAVLCPLAAAAGDALRVAPVWAGVLLLRGRGEEGLRFLDSLGLPPAEERRHPRLTLVRALLLAIGTGRVDEAGALLADERWEATPEGRRLAAARAWLLATAGELDGAGAALRSIEPAGDRETALFLAAADAAVALATDRPTQAVSHLRRAIVGVDRLRSELPWLGPHLTAGLIDALMLCGREVEATAVALDFHAARPDSGWGVSVSLSVLLGSLAGAPAGR